MHKYYIIKIIIYLTLEQKQVKMIGNKFISQ